MNVGPKTIYVIFIYLHISKKYIMLSSWLTLGHNVDIESLLSFLFERK